MTLAHWMEVLLSDQNPLLPTAEALRWYLRVAWGVLVVALALRLRNPLGAHTGRVALGPTIALSALVVWVLLPGSLSPSYWLGLAFHVPALCTVGWAIAYAIGCNWTPTAPVCRDGARAWQWGRTYAVLGVVLGYALLLDTLALLPVQLYAWGFSPAALACALLVALVPCLALNPLQRGNRWTLLMPAALLVFVLTRLPTGNVWDVLLDPLLWVALQVNLVFTVWRWARARAATRA